MAELRNDLEKAEKLLKTSKYIQDSRALQGRKNIRQKYRKDFQFHWFINFKCDIINNTTDDYCLREEVQRGLLNQFEGK